ncbi:hypothetical protein C479_07578 [Halovivax asiaticus JCM 14624]|uniref:Uncharacterized protein n=1 Tax=Halovivax asiaticus JCM 14624 TaxID=1227490 RepID=M0BJT5_9EURY|nr:hypothetical protein [Halovivax asiaticus]ELZ11151.1 hypothetical protein C479_07578 [Halovivax asiaticus JCM 14624]
MTIEQLRVDYVAIDNGAEIASELGVNESSLTLSDLHVAYLELRTSRRRISGSPTREGVNWTRLTRRRTNWYSGTGRSSR